MLKSFQLQLLICLVGLLALAILVSYKSILSYDAFVSSISDNAFAPPRRYDAIISKTAVADDAPKVRVSKNKVSKPKVPKAGKAESDIEMTMKAKDHTIRIRDFVPPSPPANVLADSAKRTPLIDFDEIATKWELPDGSIDLLKQIQSRTVAFDYNRDTDILSLRHPLKTGGTSFSWMLLEMFNETVVPGSGPSNWWQPKKFVEALGSHELDDPYWSNMAALYTHTFLRTSDGGRKNTFLEELRHGAPGLDKKRFRLMTIVRRPLDLAASSFYETQCRIGRWAKQRNIKGKVCPPVNLTDVMWKNIEHWTNKCETEFGWKTEKCRKIKEEGGESVYGHCGSVDVLLDSGNVHNMHHKSMMGDFPRPPELGDSDRIGINLTPTLKDVSLYTLRDLGGLIDFNPVHKEDFVWFAITERFKESMCLFYYYFEAEPVEERKSL
jgi:hypothetical protein